MIRSSKIAEDALPLIEIGLPPNSSHATDAPRTTWRWSMRVENDSFRRFVGDMVYAITRGIARTQYSFSTDPQLRGAPEGHVFNVRDVYLNAGAGFMVVLSGEIMTMPGCRKCRRRTTSTSTPTATSSPA